MERKIKCVDRVTGELVMKIVGVGDDMESLEVPYLEPRAVAMMTTLPHEFPSIIPSGVRIFRPSARRSLDGWETWEDWP